MIQMPLTAILLKLPFMPDMLKTVSRVLLPSVLFVMSACSKQEEASNADLLSFEVKGVLLRVQNEGRTLIIDHEEIPGYMGAMTMPFRVKDVAESEKATPGDEIQFTYNVAELESWVEGVKPTGVKRTIETPEPDPSLKKKLLKTGEPFPDFQLLDENGKEVKLTDYRGSVVALTFIFTRCPVPEYCPAMMRNFGSVEKALKTDSAAPKNYKLLTVSFDSDFDTPEVMKAYGESFGQTSANWNMLSSPKTEEIRSLGESVGLMFGKSDNAIYTHNLRTVVLDPRGRITKIFTDESWKPEELVEELKRAAIK